MTVQFERRAERLEFSYRRVRNVLLILCLLGWAIGGGGALASAFVEFENSTTLLVAKIVVGIVWLAILIQLVGLLTLVKEFSLDSDGATLTRTALGWRRTTTTPRDEVAAFSVSKVLRGVESDWWEWGIKMQTRQGQAHFMSYDLLQSELAWLCSQLNEHLARLSATQPATPGAGAGSNSGPSGDRFLDESPKIIARFGASVTVPAESRWKCRAEPRSIVFVQQGWLAPVSIIGYLLMSALVIGGAGTLASMLFRFGNDELSGIVYFAIVGLLFPIADPACRMLGGLLMALVDELRTTEWRAAANCMHSRWSWLGWGKTWTFPIARLDRLERRAARISPTGQWALCSGHGQFALVLVDDSNTDVCIVDGLTDAEVQWMADVLYRERDAWFADG